MKARTKKIMLEIKKSNPELFSDFYPELFYVSGKNGYHQVKLVNNIIDGYSFKYKVDHVNYIPFNIGVSKDLIRDDLRNICCENTVNTSCSLNYSTIEVNTLDLTQRSSYYNGYAKDFALKIEESEKVKKSNKIPNISFKKGKYKGFKVSEIIQKDKQYCQWVINNWNWNQNKLLFESIKCYLELS